MTCRSKPRPSNRSLSLSLCLSVSLFLAFIVFVQGFALLMSLLQARSSVLAFDGPNLACVHSLEEMAEKALPASAALSQTQSTCGYLRYSGVQSSIAWVRSA